MKTLTTFIALLILSINCYSQNNVTNPSFEDTATYGFPSMWNTAYQYHKSGNNSFGFQIASDSTSYISMKGYEVVPVGNGQQAIGRLNQLFPSGTCLKFSFDISLSNESKYASGNWAIYISEFPITSSTVIDSSTTPFFVFQYPAIADTSGWINIQGEQLIPHPVQYFCLYPYKCDTTAIIVNPSGTYQGGSVYYLDNVSVTIGACTPLSIQPQSEPGGRTLLKESDLWGRNIDPTQFSGIRIRYYSDNSIEKVIVIDNGF